MVGVLSAVLRESDSDLMKTRVVTGALSAVVRESDSDLVKDVVA